MILFCSTSSLLTRTDSAPFIKNGFSGAITKTPVPAKPSKEGRGKAFRQVLASFVANLGTINTGMAFGFSAVALPQLREANSAIHITEDQASWIGQFLSINMAFNLFLFILFFLIASHLSCFSWAQSMTWYL